MRAHPLHSFVGLVLLLAGLHATLVSAADALVDEATMADLMNKAGLRRVCAQLGPALLQGAKSQGKGLAPAALDLLATAVAKAFDADRLCAEQQSDLSRTVSADDAATVLAWLNTPLGMRVNKLEEDSGEPDQIQQRMEQASSFMATLPPDRAARIQRLSHAIQAVESTTIMVINTQLATIRGIAAVTPGADPDKLAALETRLRAQRSRIAANMAPKIEGDLAQKYAPLSDADLDTYVQFLETPPATRFNTAVVASYDRMLSKAAEELWRLVLQGKVARVSSEQVIAEASFEALTCPATLIG